MKTTLLLTAVLALTLGSLRAQTVPLFINYQGKVTDNLGVGLGTGTPVNRKVIFRIFDSVNSGNRLWSEQHTVTISNGEFSVLLGNGINANYSGVDEIPLKTNTPLDTVFMSAGVERFVEIVVDNGDNTLNATDAPITPRQRITSTAYSFRARSADTIASGSDLQLNANANYGLGYYGAGRLFNGVAVDGPVLFGLSGGALGSANGAAKNIALRWDATGNVISTGNISTTAGAISGASITSSGNITTVAGTISGAAVTASGNITASAGTISGLALKASGASGYTFSTADTDGGLFSPGDDIVTIKTNAAERFRATSAGVTVTGTLGSTGTISGPGSGLTGLNASNISAGTLSSARLPGGIAYTNGNQTFADSIGIGVAPTRARLDVNGGGGGTSPAMTVRYLLQSGVTGTAAVGAGGIGLVAYFGGYIAAEAVAVFSDDRIKLINQRSNAPQDLTTLMAIEITDYSFIDTVAKSDAPQKKIIAQQVEKVFPQAVSKITDVVPDIYKKASLTEAWISLESDLKVGERVRLLSEKGEGIFPVLEVAKGKFRTEFNPEVSEVFVYGREVKDFRIVDYDAISMLNVSATQQLMRENEELRKRVAALEAQEKALDAKLGSIEKRLESMERSSTRMVSLNAD